MKPEVARQALNDLLRQGGKEFNKNAEKLFGSKDFFKDIMKDTNEEERNNIKKDLKRVGGRMDANKLLFLLKVHPDKKIDDDVENVILQALYERSMLPGNAEEKKGLMQLLLKDFKYFGKVVLNTDFHEPVDDKACRNVPENSLSATDSETLREIFIGCLQRIIDINQDLNSWKRDFIRARKFYYHQIVAFAALLKYLLFFMAKTEKKDSFSRLFEEMLKKDEKYKKCFTLIVADTLIDVNKEIAQLNSISVSRKESNIRFKDNQEIIEKLSSLTATNKEAKDISESARHKNEKISVDLKEEGALEIKLKETLPEKILLFKQVENITTLDAWNKLCEKYKECRYEHSYHYPPYGKFIDYKTFPAQTKLILDMDNKSKEVQEEKTSLRNTMQMRLFNQTGEEKFSKEELLPEEKKWLLSQL